MVHEEIRWNTIDWTLSKGEDEEKIALAGKGKKGKGKKSKSKLESDQGDKKKYFSNMKCFHCHEFRHYATKFPHRKARKKDLVVAIEGEALASQFELDFTLIACIVRTMIGRIWYLDSDSSFHMMRNIEIFSDLEEKDL